MKRINSTLIAIMTVVMLCPPSSSLLTVASPQEEDLGVLTSLRWLARHQDPDGHWGVTSYVKQCKKGDACAPSPGDERYDTAVTGLSLLAFLGAGYYHGSKDIYDGICFGEVAKNGLKWLVNNQHADGGIDHGKTVNMDNHLLAGLALTEAYGLCGSDLFKAPAQKAVDFAVAAQNDDGGWGYGAKEGRSNGATAIWGVKLLVSAELSGLTFPRKNYEKARDYFITNTDAEGLTRYGGVIKESHFNESIGGYKISSQPGRRFTAHPSMTAAMMIAVIFVGKNLKDEHLIKGSEHLLNDLPAWNERAIDFHYWYLSTIALFQFDGPRGPAWSKWNGKMKDALVKNQHPKAAGCKHGSWEPVDRWSHAGGRVYATAINTISLEVYSRYASVGR